MNEPSSSAARRRTVAFVGSHHSGKTTLVEAVLAATGAISRRGSVIDGTTTTDHEPESIDRAQSTCVGFAYTQTRGIDISIIDCPGFVDFGEETKLALLAADAAVVVVEADPTRIKQVRSLVEYLDHRLLPHCFFVNKLDRPGSSYRDTLAELKAAFGKRVVAEHLPIGEGEAFRGYIDLADAQAYVYERGARMQISVAPELEAPMREARATLLETLGDFDDHLLEELLEGIEPPLAEVRDDLRAETIRDQIAPVVVGAALSDIGVGALIDAIVEQFPDASGDPAAPLVAQVCKTIHHPQSGKLSVARIRAGTLDASTILADTTRNLANLRPGGLYRLIGKRQEPVASAGPGDLVAIARLEGVQTGDTLTSGSSTILDVPPIAEPLHAVAIRPKERLDETKLSQMLARVCEEDPSLAVARAEFTGELQLLGQGDVHVATAAQRLARKYRIALQMQAPAIAYRETITASTEIRARYKHQTGGHGQFGDVVLRIEPRERGHGVTFSEAVVGGVVPRQFFPAVEKGVREALGRGAVAGFPVVDLHVTLVDGAYHAVDSSEASFKTAASMAVRDGLPRCTPVLLEPIVELIALVPDEYASAILGGITAKRGHVVSFESVDPPGTHQIVAHVPQAELAHYVTELRTATAGLGTFRWRHDRFEAAPPKVSASVRETVGA